MPLSYPPAPLSLLPFSPMPDDLQGTHPLLLPWSMPRPKSQNPVHPPPLRCAVHQSSQCPRICIAKPQTAMKCVLCSRTTCVQGTRVICIGVRCSRWRALSARSSGRLCSKALFGAQRQVLPGRGCFQALLTILPMLMFCFFQMSSDGDQHRWTRVHTGRDACRF